VNAAVNPPRELAENSVGKTVQRVSSGTRVRNLKISLRIGAHLKLVAFSVVFPFRNTHPKNAKTG
jgi:hypothetical protein